ncbi:hypothetical protein HYW42_04270 [Candidatus Daviesbacteria bacterium]|nr:hypothetical protein [Candidatus Daviesbacteria bacterium]
MKKIISIFILTSVFLILPLPVFAATLSLSPSTGNFNKGCDVTVDINLNTEGVQTDGTDAIVLYDSSRLTANQIVSGQIYSDYPGNNIDEQSGKITISGLSSVSSAFSGSGTFAKINFTVKDNASVGVTQVKFDFDSNDKSKTTDSNVVERGTVADVLSSVVNGNYTIGSGACTVQGSPPTIVVTPPVSQGGISTPSGAVKTPVKTIDDMVGGKTGSQEFSYMLAILGVTMAVLGVLGFALL